MDESELDTDRAFEAAAADGERPSRGSLWDRIKSFFTAPPAESEETPDPQPEDPVFDEARARVATYYSSGEAEQHQARLGDTYYSGTLDYAINAEIEHLERHVEEYEKCISRYRPRAWEDVEFWAGLITKTLAAIADAEATLPRLRAETERVEALWLSGRLSRPAYDDMIHNIGRKEQRAITRLGMGALGGSYEEIGDTAESSGHIIEDALADDNGDARHKIAMKIRGMPRAIALEIIAQAVEDGEISQEAADYLIVQYVRPR